MTPKKYYDWRTAGGTDDVMRLVDCLERAEFAWCAIGGVAVNHWADEPMVTQIESHPQLWESLDTELKAIIKKQLDLFVGEKYGRDRDR
jgi:hypothetical protein